MDFILSHVEQGVMTLTLNRPERLNSFNEEMHLQLAECLKQAERDDSVRCLLVTGAGRGFCAGQDLNDRNVDPNSPAPDLGRVSRAAPGRWGWLCSGRRSALSRPMPGG